MRQLDAAPRCSEVKEFQRRALDIVGGHIAVDAAWWGGGTFGEGVQLVHGSLPDRQPACGP